MMKILVTGGAGFIGSHLVDKLIKKGYKVAVIDNLSTGKKENLNPKAKFYKIDICSPEISRIFKKEMPRAVFHYAAQINGQKSAENPMANAKADILGSLNVIQNFIKTNQLNRSEGAHKIIFASSVGVYGEPKNLPVKESHPLNPATSYPVAKLAIENYLNYFKSRGLDSVSLRYSNVYGPRQPSKTGEGGVIAVFISKILKKEKPIILDRGKQTRDFLYVDDAVNAAILAFCAQKSSIYNVGTNKEITINALLKLISGILKVKTEPIFQPLRRGEIIRSRIDYSRIKKELGWQPKCALEKGLRETAEWFSRR